jgi:hypothetical protein
MSRVTNKTGIHALIHLLLSAVLSQVLTGFSAKPHDRIVCNIINLNYADDIVTATLRIRATGLLSEVSISTTTLGNLVRLTRFKNEANPVALIDNNRYQYADAPYVAVKPGGEIVVSVKVNCEGGPKHGYKWMTALKVGQYDLNYALFSDIVVRRSNGELGIIKALGSGAVTLTIK